MIVSLTKLRQLVTVAGCRNLTRAAEELNISQPALSRTVAFIEQVYGLKIFDRTPQGMLTTEAGAAIVAEAEHLLRTAQAFDHNANLICGGKLGHVSFGMGPILADTLMGKAGIALLRDGRQISFHAETRRPDHLVKRLLDEDIELALVGRAEYDLPDEIEVQRIGAMRIAAIGRRGHPLADRMRVSLAQLRLFPVAAPLDLNNLPTFRPVPHSIACDDYAAIKEIVGGTDAVCLCSAAFAHSAVALGKAVMLDLAISSLEEEIEVIAMTLKGRTRSPAVEVVIECCRELLAAAAD